MKPYNLRWRGMLTRGNAADVALLFKELLSRRRFTYTHVRPSLLPALDHLPQMIDTRVEVHTRQKLERRSLEDKRQSAVSIFFFEDAASLSVNATEYLCIYQTNLVGNSAPFDCTYKNPYVAIDGDRITVKYQTPCGDQAVDVFTLEVR